HRHHDAATAHPKQAGEKAHHHPEHGVGEPPDIHIHEVLSCSGLRRRRSLAGRRNPELSTTQRAAGKPGGNKRPCAQAHTRAIEATRCSVPRPCRRDVPSRIPYSRWARRRGERRACAPPPIEEKTVKRTQRLLAVGLSASTLN